MRVADQTGSARSRITDISFKMPHKITTISPVASLVPRCLKWGTLHLGSFTSFFFLTH